MSGVRCISSHSTSQEINAPLPLSRLYSGLLPSCHLWATVKLTRTWSSKTRKFCFCVTAAARPLYVHWTTKTAVVAQQVVQRRQSGGRTIAIVVQGLLRSPSWATVVATVCWGGQCPTLVYSFCDQRRCVYLPPASLERPTSSATFVRLFLTCSKPHGDHGSHGVVWTSSVPPLNDQGNLSAFAVPSTATWPILWSHKGDIKVAVPV